MTELEYDWRPTAGLDALRERAACLKWIRAFFAHRDVLEVETPLLMTSTVTDPQVDGYGVPGCDNERFLQTSPEYAMKRLLAAGSGSIYQICKAFRAGEAGRRHNPEFSILEWYRVGFDHMALMDEVELLVGGILQRSESERISYAALFDEFLGINPHVVDDMELKRLVRVETDTDFNDAPRDTWLDLLMSTVIEPRLSDRGMLFVYDYPASQAALAQRHLNADGHSVGQRFELYVDGLELVNGYHELTDSVEQAERFKSDNQLRSQMQRTTRTVDARLLSALAQGMPACAGAALGLDRLLMLVGGREALADVLSFDWSHS